MIKQRQEGLGEVGILLTQSQAKTKAGKPRAEVPTFCPHHMGRYVSVFTQPVTTHLTMVSDKRFMNSAGVHELSEDLIISFTRPAECQL